MSEIKPGLSPEASLEDAERLFKKLTNMALQQSVWTPWQRLGASWQDRTRGVAYEREVATTYSSVIYPKYNDPAWAGPTYILETGQGTINRKLTIDDRELAPFKRKWRRQPPPVTYTHRLDVTVSNERAHVPEFDPPRELTEAEIEALAPYGGGGHVIAFDRQNVPEARYRVEQTSDELKVLEYRRSGSFSRDFVAVDTVAGLVAVNGLLYDELGSPEVK